MSETYDWLCNACSEGVEEALSIGGLGIAFCAKCGKECAPGEIQAVTNYLKSLINLYRLEGSLLERRGIRLEETGKGPVLPSS